MSIYKDKELLFIHIPKNAGTSISFLLNKSFNVKEQPDAHKRLEEYNDIDNYYVFTVLRDPIDRAMSHYRWFRESSDYRQFPHKKIAVNHTFEDWLNIWYIPKAKTQFQFISKGDKFLDYVTLLSYENINYELDYYLNTFLNLSIDVNSIGNNKKTDKTNKLEILKPTLKKLMDKEHWLYDNNYY